MQNETLARYYLENEDEPYRKLNTELVDWQKKKTDMENAIPTTMVMEEMPKPRETTMLIRGQYDQKGDRVWPGTPAVLSPLPYRPPAKAATRAIWQP